MKGEGGKWVTKNEEPNIRCSLTLPSFFNPTRRFWFPLFHPWTLKGMSQASGNKEREEKRYWYHLFFILSASLFFSLDWTNERHVPFGTVVLYQTHSPLSLSLLLNNGHGEMYNETYQTWHTLNGHVWLVSVSNIHPYIICSIHWPVKGETPAGKTCCFFRTEFRQEFHGKKYSSFPSTWPMLTTVIPKAKENLDSVYLNKEWRKDDEFCIVCNKTIHIPFNSFCLIFLLSSIQFLSNSTFRFFQDFSSRENCWLFTWPFLTISFFFSRSFDGEEREIVL